VVQIGKREKECFRTKKNERIHKSEVSSEMPVFFPGTCFRPDKIPRRPARSHRTERASQLPHRWSSGRILPCHGRDPGSIPGRCTVRTFLAATLLQSLFGRYLFALALPPLHRQPPVQGPRHTTPLPRGRRLRLRPNVSTPGFEPAAGKHLLRRSLFLKKNNKQQHHQGSQGVYKNNCTFAQNS